MNALCLANLFFAGILAGMEVAIHYGYGAAPEILSDQSQILLRQALVRKLRVLVPSFFVPALVSGIALAVLDNSAPGRWFRWAGLLSMLVWIITRAIMTVPVNKATLAWDPASPPQNWRALVERTEICHVIGAWAAVIAFACFLTAVAFRLPQSS